MKTDDLIAHLANQATPMRPLAPPAHRAAMWLAIAGAFASAGILVLRPRPDLAELVTRAGFLAGTTLALATTVVAAWTAFVLAIPGAERSSALRKVSLAILLIWLVVILGGTISAGIGLAGRSDWYICFARVVAVGLLPGVAVTSMIRRAAPLEPAWTAALTAAAAMATGAFVMPFVCPVDDAGHALLGHFGPVALTAAGAALAGERLLGRARPG